MSQELAPILPDLSIDQRKTLARDKLRILREWLSGKAPQDIATRYGMTVSDVSNTVETVRDDIATMRLDIDGFDGQLVCILLDDLKRLSEIETKLSDKEKLEFRAVTSPGKVETLWKEESTRDSRPKYFQVRMQILKQIRELIAINSAVKEPGPQESLMSMVFDRISEIASEKGKLEGKLEESRTVEIKSDSVIDVDEPEEKDDVDKK